MIKVKAKWLTDLLGFSGITILFFVFHNGLKGPGYTDEWVKEFWNHESIHMRQQWECGFIGQWLFYGMFYLGNRLSGMKHHVAYKNNPFEMEAYFNAPNLKYLTTRKMYSWWQYF